MMLTTKLSSIIKFKALMSYLMFTYHKLQFLSNLPKFEGGLVSEGISNFVPFSKEPNKITVPHLFNLKVKTEGQ